MADLYDDADVQTAADLAGLWLDGNRTLARPLAEAILETVAPVIAANALRDTAEEYTTLIPDALGYKVQAVFTEDLHERAAEYERGFGK